MISEYEKVMSYLEDEESRFIYKKRVEYKETGNFSAIQEIVDKYLPECKDKPYRSKEQLELELAKAMKDKDKIVIFGAGDGGKQVLNLLQRHGIKVDAIVDNDSEKWGISMNGLKIECPEDCDCEKMCYIVSPMNEDVASEICKQLLSLGVKEKSIYKYTDYISRLIILEDKQYFDEKIIHFNEGEVFVDAGVLNLNTSKTFIKKCEEHHVKNFQIYAFEPNMDSYEKCCGILDNMKNADIKLYNYGLWSENATLYFQNHGSGSRIISDKTDTYVNVVSLDSIIKGNVTFIKMDVEGAELEALRGGGNLIKKWKPRLAISIYHKAEDLTEIPLFIKELVPEYKFYIRHYCNMECETVLYAVI